MVDLRDSTVLVNNVEEYIAVAKIAKKQGFRWASGAPLNRVLCEFPRCTSMRVHVLHMRNNGA
jgi:hypothetical protein